MKLTRSSKARNGLAAPPSRSIWPAHTLHDFGLSGSAPSTRPRHATNTDVKVSILMSSGRSGLTCSFVVRMENSWAEYALRHVSDRCIVFDHVRTHEEAIKRQGSPELVKAPTLLSSFVGSVARMVVDMILKHKESRRSGRERNSRSLVH